MLALRQARGRIDADLIQRETQRMLAGLEGQLSTHAAQMQEKLAGSLKEYFDPQSGRFDERVQQLIKHDGELEQLLRRQIGSEDSELAKTLVVHFGRQSPLMKLLDPGESEGLLSALGQTVEGQLTAQRNHVLREFSLDNKEGALARMIGELTANHGQLTDALQKKIDTVVAEFSLDKEDSALSRLVRNVDRAKHDHARVLARRRIVGLVAAGDDSGKHAHRDRRQPDARWRQLVAGAAAARAGGDSRQAHAVEHRVSRRSEGGAGQDDRAARGVGALDAARRGLRRGRVPVSRTSRRTSRATSPRAPGKRPG